MIHDYHRFIHRYGMTANDSAISFFVRWKGKPLAPHQKPQCEALWPHRGIYTLFRTWLATWQWSIGQSRKAM